MKRTGEDQFIVPALKSFPKLDTWHDFLYTV